MRIVVGGAGEVGFHIARVLRSEGHDLVIIENDPEMVKRAKSIDALVIEGNAASPGVLERAMVGNADVYIGVTGSDEVNLFSCAVASTRLVRTIARVNEFEFMGSEARDAFERLGIKKVFCPDLVSARTLVRLIDTPSVVDIRPMAGGDAFVLVLRASKRSPVANKRISSLDMPPEAKILGLYESGNIIIPRDVYKIRAGQRVVLILNDIDALGRLERLFGKRSLKRVNTVFISGANDIGIHIAKQLERKRTVVLMDDSPERAEHASRTLSRAHPVVGDSTNTKDMEDAGIASADVFIAASEDEERNALSCFHAKRLGAKRTLAVISNHDLADMASDIGLDIVVNPRWATIGAILESVHEVEYEAVRLMHRDEAQLLALEVSNTSRVIGRPVRSVNIAGEAVVGAILRRGLAPDGRVVRKVKIARDNDLLMAGDHLIVFALREAIPRLRKELK